MRRKFLRISILFLTITSCKEEDEIVRCGFDFTYDYTETDIANPPAPEYPCDYFSLNKDGKPLTLHGAASYYQDSLYISGGGGPEFYTLKIFYEGPGEYTLTPTGSVYNSTAHHYTIWAGDIISSYYVLDKNAVIKIIEHEESQNVIKGTFNLSMKNARQDQGGQILLDNGEFSIHLPSEKH